MHFELRFGFLFLIGWCAIATAFGQHFKPISPPVMVGTHQLKYPWTGGMNTPQIMNADLNLDQKQDVVIFDRSGGVWMPFISDGELNYDATFKSIFPKVHDWVVMKDHNNDGLADIFSYSTTPGLAGIEVYDASVGGKTLSFTKRSFPIDRANILYYTSGSSRINVYVSNADYPAVEDIDRDGDLDILSYEPGGGLIVWYKNLATEKGLATGQFDFVVGDFCFGKILENGFSDQITLSLSKDKCASGLSSGLEVRHAGSTLLAWDRDQDRDYDLVIGDISSPNLIFLRNGGDSSAAWMNSQELKFPTNSISVDIPYFVSPFLADINNDGIKEFFAASNFQYGSDNYHCLWRYDRSELIKSEYVFHSNSFITDETLDFGENTSPALADIDADGDLDLIIGSGGYFDRSGIHGAALFLFRNIGDARNPSFQLIDSNWLDFKKFNNETNSFVPCFGDLDGDGDQDLIVGELLGRLFFAENVGGKNNPMQFGQIQSSYFQIDVGQYSSPQIIDLDADGLQDLVVGERDGVINFFKNTGTSTKPAFSSTPTINPLGSIDTRVAGFATGNAAPVIFTSRGEKYMAVGTSGKSLLLYDHPGASSAPFNLSQMTWGSVQEGDDTHLAVADIDQDGLLDMIVGNQRGGVAWYQTDLKSEFSTATRHQESDFASIQVFPNPASNYITILFDGINAIGSYSIYDVSGRLVLKTNKQSRATQIFTGTLLSGVYLVELRVGQNRYRQKLIIQ
ncbi:MAG: T9SS type A sorting domain-containing protein [Saprospiraceae bacterium]|nr:T9SS type A sorting domain-containing protein [Saprospiraceae bacterium]MBK8280655.1 T9SS type A sorting domain-containing protein [Saprospiraceae bacterium]